MNSQPISLIRGHDSVVPVRIELGYAPLDLSMATAATFTAKPGELSTVVKITKTLGSGVTAGSTAIVAQASGFNTGMFAGSQDHSLPAGTDAAFSFMAGVSLSAVGTARITYGKGSSDPLGRFAPSWGFEFESGRVRGFWKQSASEGETGWFAVQTTNWAHKLGLLRRGRVLSFYVGAVKIGDDLTATDDWSSEYYRGMCAEVRNNTDAADNRIRFGRVMFS